MSIGGFGPLSRLLSRDRPILLDAAMGTEIDRRGLPTTLPLWSAIGLIERPDLVRAIHLDNLRAGTDVITTNTFRTTERTLRRAGHDAESAEVLTRLAVDIAVEARALAGRTQALIAGSIAPLEDCYSPWLTPPFPEALTEHRRQASTLAAAGVDFILVETMPTADEAEAALIAAKETGIEAAVGFVCSSTRSSDGRVTLLNEEPLAVAARRVAAHGPKAILVNCAAPAAITAALAELATICDLPIGGYANVGTVNDTTGWTADRDLPGEVYAGIAAEWLRLGARLVGGCCGTTTEHTAALRALLDRWDTAIRFDAGVTSRRGR